MNIQEITLEKKTVNLNNPKNYVSIIEYMRYYKISYFLNPTTYFYQRLKPKYRYLYTGIKYKERRERNTLLLIIRQHIKYFRPEIILYPRFDLRYEMPKLKVNINTYRQWRAKLNEKEEEAAKKLLLLKHKYPWLYSGYGAGAWNHTYIMPRDTDPVYLLNAIKKFRLKQS